MRRPWIAIGAAAILLLLVGLAVGRRTLEPPRRDAEPAVTITVPAENREPTSSVLPRSPTAPYARTREGAVTAAAAHLRALGGPDVVDVRAIRATLNAIASSHARDDLIRAYELAAAEAGERLGVDASASPALVLRGTPVGYRVDAFDRDAATISIWRVGIVASRAVEPRQSWRTETVSLVWEDGAWKLDAVRSSPGPTPPLAGSPPSPPSDLSAAIPTFEEFSRELP